MVSCTEKLPVLQADTCKMGMLEASRVNFTRALARNPLPESSSISVARREFGSANNFGFSAVVGLLSSNRNARMLVATRNKTHEVIKRMGTARPRTLRLRTGVATSSGNGSGVLGGCVGL